MNKEFPGVLRRNHTEEVTVERYAPGTLNISVWFGGRHVGSGRTSYELA